MKHESRLTRPVAGFKKLAFAPRVMKVLDTMEALPDMHPASFDEARTAMLAAREAIGGDLMADEKLRALIEHNPDVFQMLTGAGIPEGKTAFFVMIPLNDQGAFSIVDGSFRGIDPDLSCVTRPGEQPAAVYASLILTPGAFGPAVPAMAIHFSKLAPEGCAMFLRAVTEHSQRLFPALGFIKAGDIYPGAPEDLLVVLPEAEVSPRRIDEKRVPAMPPVPEMRAAPAPAPAPKPQKTITVRVARTMEDMLKVFSIRSATYMSEQVCPYDEEFDGNDFCAMHLIGEIDGEPAGCLRMRFFGEFVKIERLAVRREFRNTKLAFKLAREGVDMARRKGFRQLYGHSRKDLTRFWACFGFRVMEDKPGFDFSGVDYVEIRADLEPHDNPITIGLDPMVMIRPEGSWDQPGPLDRSRDRVLEPEVAERMRTVGGARAR